MELSRVKTDEPDKNQSRQQIRAKYDVNTICVYQAYGDAIANSALNAGTFISPPFNIKRMTWIKPSFLWMMYRSGWATKPEQTRILSITMHRWGFEDALSLACLSTFDRAIHASVEVWKRKLNSSPVRVQWDPDRNMSLQPLHYRAIQIGLSGPAVQKFMHTWIVNIEDITSLVHRVRDLLKSGNSTAAAHLLPRELLYPLPENIAHNIGAHAGLRP